MCIHGVVGIFITSSSTRKRPRLFRRTLRANIALIPRVGLIMHQVGFELYQTTVSFVVDGISFWGSQFIGTEPVDRGDAPVAYRLLYMFSDSGSTGFE